MKIKVEMRTYLKVKDYSVSKEEFQLRCDDKEEVLQTFPVPLNLETYYESDDYISHTDANSSLLDIIYQTVKKINLASKLKLISSFAEEGKSLLDVGAGTGDFVFTAKQNGWNVSGIEPNPKARALAKEKGIDLVTALDRLPQASFDVITLWHVLEHLPELENDIDNLRKLLKPNGTLVIAVPNFKSWDAKYYKQFWAAYDVPRHLWHFSKQGIKSLFSPFQLKIEKIKPMWFDAFYVSILSEKYKTGRKKFFKGIWYGFRSNLSYLSTKECSSHIYILKKTK
ncbi:class I SAM-dependent methyltransferase [Flavobacterium sp. ASW18X]|uniref:class I SAM-dependent methyltransferase n=1 Tax=Flavobacterium sp. ASW18X TaxID=2572595 RepID=UPI003510DC54